jgi:Domain of unknown function (DUF4386)
MTTIGSMAKHAPVDGTPPDQHGPDDGLTMRGALRSERRVAIAVGLLYMVATVAGLLAAAALGSLLQGPTALAGLAAHEGRVMATAFFELVVAVAVAGVGFMIYPLLKHDADTPGRQGLALWYVGTRITEGALFLVGILGLLSLFQLSQEAATAGASQPVHYQAAFKMLKSASDYSWVLGQSVFCAGALMLYYLLYVSGRIPRWLSVWGLVGVPLMLAAGFSLAITGDPNSTFSSIMYAPLALQEMVLAVWLIFKGFNSPAVTSSGAATDEVSR